MRCACTWRSIRVVTSRSSGDCPGRTRDNFYKTGALTLVSAIVRKVTGRPLDEFARETLFQPLGITSVEPGFGQRG